MPLMGMCSSRMLFGLLLIAVTQFGTVTAPDTISNIAAKVACGYPLEEGSINLGDGYATNLEVFIGCLLQWVILFAVYRTKYEKWPSFLFQSQKPESESQNSAEGTSKTTVAKGAKGKMSPEQRV